MDFDYSEIYHQSSKDHRRGHPPISSNPAEWPEAWKRQEYKVYPRSPKIALPDERPRADFFELVARRHSGRQYQPVSPLSLTELSVLLRYSCGTFKRAWQKTASRAQPSGGARFPIEVYPLVLVSGPEISSGVYHYDVQNHQLEVIEQRAFERKDIQQLSLFDWTGNASLLLVMTAVFERNQMKYGERGYRYTLLEAGHIGQNIHLVVEALGLECCALGGTRDQPLEAALAIDGITESVVYAFSIGRYQGEA